MCYMNDLLRKYEMASLLAKELMEVISKEEQQRLDAWRTGSRRRMSLRENVRARIGKNDEDFFERITENDWGKVQKRLAMYNVRRSYKTFLSIAALVALIIGFVLVYPLGDDSRGVSEVALLSQESFDAKGVLLRMGNGREVCLGDSAIQELNVGNTCWQSKNGELLYGKMHNDVGESEISWNTIVIPRGKIYKITLSDGSCVWLNANTTMEFPSVFGGNERRVKLAGEAYFEVAENSACPFRVEANGLTVQVLGTEFNVCAYGGEDATAVTLADGKVEVNIGGKSVELKPNEQYVLENTTGIGNVYSVNAADYSAWRDGVLHFSGMNLEWFAERLSMWYDVDFIFASEGIKRMKFSGTFRKCDGLQTILQIVEEIADVEFEINGESVYVK